MSEPCKDEHGVFVKFTNYTNDLMKGKLYCNNLDYFRNAETINGLGDPEEGVLYDDSKDFSLEYELSGETNFLFCMVFLRTSRTSNGKGFAKLSDEQRENFRKFGTNDTITIAIPDIFIKKVRDACDKKGICHYDSCVRYVERTAENIKTLTQSSKVDVGQVVLGSAFIKPKTYEWQCEYRFLFYNVPENMIEDGHFILDIGPLNENTEKIKGGVLAIEYKDVFKKYDEWMSSIEDKHQ